MSKYYDEVYLRKDVDPRVEAAPAKFYYLAGPMSGVPDGNARAFREAAEALRAKGYNIVSPTELDSDLPHGEYQPTCQEWREFLARDLQLVTD